MIQGDRIFVKPAPGLMVRDEYTMQPIPADGDWVKLTRLVQRRLRKFGSPGDEAADLIECSPPAEHAEQVADVSGDAPFAIEGNTVAADAATGISIEGSPRRRGKASATATESEG